MAQKAIRPIRVEDNLAFITLTKGYEAIIDAVDVPLAHEKHWFAHRNRQAVYAATMVQRADGSRMMLYLHATLTGYDMTDHVDGDGLNNRRSNLRPATQVQNLWNQRKPVNNTSGFKGVSWNKEKARWRAQIRFNGPRVHLGYFDTPEAAHAAYVEASARLHGEFGRAA